MEKGEVEFIRSTIQKYIPGAKPYLFGSILDDSARGGDVDIYISLPEGVPSPSISQLAMLQLELEEFLMRPVDLVLEGSFPLPSPSFPLFPISDGRKKPAR